MRYLLSSILLVLFISCASYPKKTGLTKSHLGYVRVSNPYFSDHTKDYVYKANIEAFGNSFGGIFIVKKLGEKHHRMAFTTEMGNKIFDFTFLKDEFKVNFILKKMDKKLLINILKKDFRVLVNEHPSINEFFLFQPNDTTLVYKGAGENKKHSYYLNMLTHQLSTISRIRGKKEIVKFTFSEISDNIAHDIQILHQNFDLKIILKAI